MGELKKKGVFLLEPKNKGVFTVNFKHPILKDANGNGKVVTRSLGADIGKDYNLANEFMNELKAIINNKECCESYYGFLEGLDRYSEKSMKIVFDNTSFIEDYYYDINKSILEKFINFNKIYYNNRIENILEKIENNLQLESYTKRIQFLGENSNISRKIFSLAIGNDKSSFIHNYSNSKRKANLELYCHGKAEKFEFIGTLYPERIINEKIEIKFIIENIFKKISSLGNEFKYELRFREKKSGKNYFIKNNEDYYTINFFDHIEELAYIYFQISYNDNSKKILENKLKEKFLWVLESFFNNRDEFGNTHSIFSDIRLSGNFGEEESAHNKINDFILADYNGSIDEISNTFLTSEIRKNLVCSDEIIWLFNMDEEGFANNLEILKYLIINGYLNKTKIYPYEGRFFSFDFDNSQNYFKGKFNNNSDELEACNIFKFFLKVNFQNLLEKLEEDEDLFSQKIIKDRKEYYLNLILHNIVYPYSKEGEFLESKEITHRLFSENQDLIQKNIKKNKFIKEYKPVYKYEKLVYLSLDINYEFSKRFLKKLRVSTSKNIREFLLRMVHNFGGREFRNLYPEKFLENLIKDRLGAFLLEPVKIEKGIDILDFEKSIEYIMESISGEIIKEIEVLIRESNLLKWQEILKNSKDDEKIMFLIEEIIKDTFIVNHDFIKEDKVLKIIKNVLQKSDLFKSIKGELSIF